MGESTEHEMTCRATFPSGAQEWFCPICERHLVIRAAPDVQRLVLKEGDGNAVHTGRLGDIRLTGEAVVRPSVDTEHAWRQWLDENGIDWDGVA